MTLVYTCTALFSQEARGINFIFGHAFLWLKSDRSFLEVSSQGGKNDHVPFHRACPLNIGAQRSFLAYHERSGKHDLHHVGHSCHKMLQRALAGTTFDRGKNHKIGIRSYLLRDSSTSRAFTRTREKMGESDLCANDRAFFSVDVQLYVPIIQGPIAATKLVSLTSFSITLTSQKDPVLGRND